jgi:hypothetical protein
MYKVWTEFEKKFISDNAASLHDEVLAKKLEEMTGRKVTINAVRKQRKLMGIKKVAGRSKCGIAAQSDTVPAGLAETSNG